MIQLIIPVNFIFADGLTGENDIVNEEVEQIEEKDNNDGGEEENLGDKEIEEEVKEVEISDDEKDKIKELELELKRLEEADKKDEIKEEDILALEERVKELENDEIKRNLFGRLEALRKTLKLDETKGPLDKTIITDVNMIVDGKVIEVNDEGKSETIKVNEESEVFIEYEWKIPDDMEVKNGDSIEIKLPKDIRVPNNVKNGIPLEWFNPLTEEKVEIGTFKADPDTGILTVTFNDVLGNLKNRFGAFRFAYDISKEDFDDNIDKNIIFEEPIIKDGEGNNKPPKDFEIEYIDDDVSTERVTIAKSGLASPIENPENIDWVVDINTKLESLTDLVIEDNIPEGLELIGVEVIKLKIGANGKITEDSSLGKVNSFPINLGNTNKAYRLKYRTRIVDRSIEKFTNTVKLSSKEKSDEDSEDIDIERPEFLSKTGQITGDNKIKWTITVNGAGYDKILVEDTVEKNHKFLPDSLKVDGQKVSPDEFTEDSFKYTIINPDKDKNKLYKIEYETEIDYDDSIVSGSMVEFKNSVNAKGKDKDDKTLIEEEKDSTVSKWREKIVQKWYQNIETRVIDGEYKKIAHWTISINSGREKLKDGFTIKDIVGEGQIFSEENFKIFSTSGGELEKEYYELVKTDDGFKVVFHLPEDKQSETFRIDYETILGNDSWNDPNKPYLNTVGLDEKPGEDITTSIPPNALNTVIRKSHKDLDIEALLVTWRIDIESKLGRFDKLNLTDYMSSNQKFIDNSIVAYLNGDELIKGSDYITVRGGVDKSKFTFELTKLGLAKQAENTDSKLVIEYKASFHIDDESEETTIDQVLANKVEATVKPEHKDKEENLKAEDLVTLEDWVAKNGVKYGAIDIREGRIAWEAYLNPLHNDYDEYTIVDRLSEGQKVNEDSIRLYSYEMGSNGEPKILELIENKEENYRVDMDNEDGKNVGFTITMKHFYGSILVKYDSILTGHSLEEYTNTISVGEDNYDAKVQHDKHDKYVEKEGTAKAGDKVYEGDVIDWEVLLNESNSYMENVVFKDDISAGHRYIKGSLKVYDNNGREVEIGDGVDQIKVTEPENSQGQSTLTISFNGNEKHGIGNFFNLSYSTVVTASNGTIGNNASISGDGTDLGESSVENIIVKEAGSGEGQGTMKRGLVELKKVDEDGNLISGSNAKFKLTRHLFGDVIDMGVHETKDGLLVIKDLQYGEYSLEEIEAPNGHLLPEGDKKVSFMIDKDEVREDLEGKELKLENKSAKGTVKIEKLDENEEKLLGVEFELRSLDGKIIRTSVYKDEKYVFEDVPAGKYKLVETKIPEGYTTIVQNQEVEIREDGQIIELTIKNLKIKGSIKLKKVDEAGKALSGASFGLYKTKEDGSIGELIKTQKTDKNGELTFKSAEYGKYIVKEISAPEGYVLLAEEFKVEIEENEKDVVVNNGNPIENKKIRGSLRIIKADRFDGIVLEGVEFKLSNASGFEKKVTTNSDGIAEFTDLEYGSYKLEEVQPLEGYEPLGKTIDVNIKENGILIEKYVYNEKINRGIRILKVDSRNPNKGLEGAEFTLYKDSVSEDNKKRKITTGKDGVALFEALEKGKYVVKETKAPFGYEKSDEEFEFDLSINNLVEIKTVTNRQYLASIKIIKVDSKNKDKHLEGAQFGLLNEKGQTIRIGVTDKDGELIFNDLPYGNYKIKERIAPKGYRKDNTAYDIKVDKDKEVKGLDIKNQEILGDIKLKKVDKEGKAPLKAVKFGLFKKSSIERSTGIPVAVVESNENGEILFKDVKEGKYVIRELEALDGYKKLIKDINVDVNEGLYDENDEIIIDLGEIENEKYYGSIRINKFEKATSNKLEGVEFELLDKFNNVAKDKDGKEMRGKTDKEGKLEFNNLLGGSYRLKEVKALPGYDLLKDDIEIVLGEEYDDKVLELRVENRKTPVNPPIDPPVDPGKPIEPVDPNEKPKPEAEKGKIRIEKIDGETKELLEGAEFVVKDSKGKIVGKIVTDKSGNGELELEYGKYTLEETKAPNGYLRLEGSRDIEISKLNKELIETIENMKNPIDPEKPEEPKDPEDPGPKPEKPTKPGDGSDGGVVEGGDINRPGDGTDGTDGSNVEGGGLPATGETSSLVFVMLGIALVAFGVFLRKRKEA